MATVSSSEPWAYALHLPHHPRAPRVARMTLRAVLGGHGISELIDVAELLTSEVVTNSYRHSDGPASLRMRSMEGGRLRVSVWDTNPVIPAPFDKPPTLLPFLPEPDDSTGGRGLLLVQLCADNWGGFSVGAGLGGKLLWFELGQPDVAFAFAA
ncbi:ATP-binding protein [Streptomyces sp. ISL-100]|uniref:ATP-binding protein n=1 Tax=Streptomyces sp. ISL-100 TaxID=2819173 RepID=UPI001BEBA018|nr:ATP-binding protein [Streptomyces sp. ISL-100]MBT2401635.1 ATP-binding protein [Streptomyces sp. ISL-100]